MKKIIALAAALLLTVCAFAQDGKAIYNKYSDSENVSAVYISPAMFRLIGKLPDLDVNGSDMNLSGIVNSLTGFYLINSENKSINDALKADAEKLIAKGKFELIMEVKDSGEVVRMYTSGDKNTVTSFVMLVNEPNETTFISFEGSMSREELEKAIASAAASEKMK